MATFAVYDIVVTIISLLSYVSDVGTDIWLMIHFFLHGDAVWGALTLGFVAAGTLMMQIFSFYWHVADNNLDGKTLVTHMVFLAPVHRYYRVLSHGFKSRRTQRSDDVDAAYREMNDICILRLIETFLESAPQLVLQLYIVYTSMDKLGVTLGLSTVLSLVSLAWAVTAYTDALHLAYKKFYKRNCLAIMMHALWQIGMVVSRVLAVVLFASVFKALVFIPAGIHLFLMIVWIVYLNPEFGASQCEKRLFTFISAVIHTFCFLNLKDGPSRWRMLAYYSLSLVENTLLVTLWYIYRPESTPAWMEGMSFGLVFGGFGLGTICLCLYYGCCHPSGPAPVDAQKPQFHQPVSYNPGLQNEKSKPSRSIFDVSSTSARINVWLNASLDLSKDVTGGSKNVSVHDDHNSVSPDNHGNSYYGSGYVKLTQADVHQKSASCASPSTSNPLNGESLQNQTFVGSAAIVGSSEDHVDFTVTGQMIQNRSPHYNNNIIEMLQRCKLDPAYISSSSINDSVFPEMNTCLPQKHQDPSLCRSLCAYNSSPSCSNSCSQNRNQGHISYTQSNTSRSDSRNNESRHSNHYSRTQTPSSMDYEFSPTNISPLDASKLWEESQTRLETIVSPRSLVYKSDYENLSQSGMNSRDESSGIQALAYSNGVSHLSLSYSRLDKCDKTDSWNEKNLKSNSALSLSASSFVFTKGRHPSDEGALHQSTFSDPLSFSESSLQLPDSSESYSRGRRGSRFTELLQYSSDCDGDRILSRSSRRRSSPSDVQSSSYFSDRGLSSSSSAQYNTSHPSLTSSGFQSEESNLSNLGHRHHDDYKYPSPHQSTPVIENEISSIATVDTLHRSSKRGTRHKSGTVDQDVSPILQLQDSGVLKHPVVSSLQSNASVHLSQSNSPVLPPLSLSSRRSSGSSGSGRFFKDPSLPFEEGRSSSDESLCPSSTGVISNLAESRGLEKSSLSALISDVSSRVTSTQSSVETLSMDSNQNGVLSPCSSVSPMKKTKSLPQINMKMSIAADKTTPRPSSSTLTYENLSNFQYSDSDLTTSYRSDKNRSLLSQKLVSDCPWRSDYMYLSRFPTATEADQWEVYTELSEADSVHCKPVEQMTAVKKSDCGGVPVPVDDMDDSPYRLGRSVDVFNRERWRASLDKEMQKKMEQDIQTCRESMAPKKLYELHKKNMVRKLSPVEVTELSESPYKFRRAPSPNYENVFSVNKVSPLAADLHMEQSVPVQKSVNVPAFQSDTDVIAKGISSVRGELEEGNNFGQSLEFSGTKSPLNTSGINSAFKPVKPHRKSIGTSKSRRESDTFTIFDESNDNSRGSAMSRTFNKTTSSLERSQVGSRMDKSRRRSSISRYSCGIDANSPFPWLESGVDSAVCSDQSNNNTPVNYLKLVNKAPLSFSATSFPVDENTSRGLHSYTDSIPWEETASKSSSSIDQSSAPVQREPLKSLENTPEFSPIHMIANNEARSGNLDIFNRKRLMSTPKVPNTNTRVSLSGVSVDSASFANEDRSRRQSYGVENKSAQNNTSTWSSQQDFEDELLKNLEENYDTSASLYI